MLEIATVCPLDVAKPKSCCALEVAAEHDKIALTARSLLSLVKIAFSLSLKTLSGILDAVRRNRVDAIS